MEQQIKPKEGISKKTFWYSYLIANFTWLFVYMHLFTLLFEDGFWGVLVILPALVILTIYGIILNVVLLIAKKSNNATSFFNKSSIFLAIGITIFGFLLFSSFMDYKNKTERSKSTAIYNEVKDIVLENANSFEDCKQMTLVLDITKYQEKNLLRECTKKIIYLTKDIDSCLSMSKSLEIPLDLSISSSCIYLYANITENRDHCNLFAHVRGGERYVESCKKLGAPYDPNWKN